MKSLIAVIIILTAVSGMSQTDFEKILREKGEVYFKFDVLNKTDISSFSNIISIDNVREHTVYAYANEKGFYEFLKRNVCYEILRHPGELTIPEMSSDIDDITEWDVYPTYDAYVNLMSQFELLHPDICKIIDAGTSIQGRKILFAKISDNVNVREAEPQFMFSSSMHGDETTGYVLMLRLIDSLLSSYGSNSRITNMIDNMEIWINPLANPDGTYRSGNNTVYGAIRGNAAFIDLNRNFPDPQDGPHPDGNTWQPETLTMMSLSGVNNFILSANFHGGTEVVNYPWDTWPTLHADNNWFMFISHLYADTCQANSPSTYMNGYNDGITNGYAWYEVNGGRQDYFTYFRHGREVTIEISDTKLLSASLLPAHWNYNRKSFLTYIENCLYGVKGIITDTASVPLKAMVKITGHDTDSSEVYSHPVTGDYYRMLAPGTYSITFSKPGYFSQTINSVQALNFQSTVVNVKLVPDGTPVELISFRGVQQNNNAELGWETGSETNNKGFEVQRSSQAGEWITRSFIPGAGTTSERQSYSYIDKNILPGIYIYRLKQVDFNGSFSFSEDIRIETGVNEYVLYQNYPNPFNPTTKLRYRIAYAGMVSLILYDALGNEVKRLVREYHQPGTYETDIDGSRLSNGVYFARLYAGGFIKSIKLNLLK